MNPKKSWQIDEVCLRLASLVESWDDAVIIATLDAIIIGWNSGAERIYGYLAKEIKGKCASIIVPSDRPDELTQLLERLKRGERIAHYETVRVRKDGNQIFVSLSLSPIKNAEGRIVGVSSIARDITERKKSENALRESEARLRGILETAVDGIITVYENGIIESFNPAAERIFGYSAREIIGQSINILMPPSYRDVHNGYIASYLRTGLKKIIGIGREVVGMRKDGTIFPMQLAVSEVHMGQRRLFTGIVRDLTEQKFLEKQVLQGERLATIGKMAAKVAHEIRNPLSSISLNAELLEDEINSYDAVNTEEAKSLLKSIIAEIDRVNSLTEEYLQFSRLPESQLFKGNINQVIEEMIEFLGHELRQKKIEIEYILQNTLLEVRFDSVQIRRALLNIIRNAIEAMPKGGKLKISTEKKDQRAIIHIEDTGVGIPPDAIEKIYDPFFTTKDFGTGLGLAVVQQIIQEHAGQVSCTSQIGQGTTFSIMLPLDKTE